jgi:hypothetical protein
MTNTITMIHTIMDYRITIQAIIRIITHLAELIRIPILIITDKILASIVIAAILGGIQLD